MVVRSLPLLSRLRNPTAEAGASRHSPGLVRRIGLAFALRRHRRQLRKLDEHLLQDIGITRQQAQAEADRCFWDAPDHWRR